VQVAGVVVRRQDLAEGRVGAVAEEEEVVVVEEAAVADVVVEEELEVTNGGRGSIRRREKDF
jgi:hypothetical protein